MDAHGPAPTIDLAPADILRIALAAYSSTRTVRRCYAATPRHRPRGSTLARVAMAARSLGLPEPAAALGLARSAA